MSPFHLTFFLTILHTINATTTDKPENSKGFLSFLFDSCNCRCGIPNREGRIIGGEYVGPHEFPWLVLVHAVGRKTSVGSLINNKYVVTTASMVLNFGGFSATPFDVKVTVGLYDRCHPDVSSTKHSTEKLIVHPDYHPGKGTHNLGLIKLNSPVAFERRVSPICLPYPSSKYVGQVGAAISWPEANEGGEKPFCRARKMGLPILEEGHCGASAHNSGVGCAGVVGAPGLICKDDEGSPVMFRSYKGVYELVADNECSGVVGVSYFMMIGRHLSWIVQNTKDACYCFKT